MVVFRQEGADQRRRLIHLLVEREVAGVEDVDLRVGRVAPVGFSLGQRE